MPLCLRFDMRMFRYNPGLRAEFRVYVRRRTALPQNMPRMPRLRHLLPYLLLKHQLLRLHLWLPRLPMRLRSCLPGLLLWHPLRLPHLP